jgi:DedD protein
VDRQLKERLIGAAVLIAIAVILVPEMFSGSRQRSAATVPDSVNAGQLKTYQIDLQASSLDAAAPQATAVEPPAPTPQDESPMALNSQLPAPVTAAIAPSRAPSRASSSAASTSSSSSVAVVSNHAAVSSAASSRTVATPGPSKPDTEKPKVAAGRWVVQIGSFGAADKAQQIVARIKTQGFAASITPIKAGGKTLYRVRTGVLAERAAAEAALKKLKTSYPDASLVPLS